MFTKKVPEPPKQYELMLEEELTKALADLKRSMGDPEKYAKQLAFVERLHEMVIKETKPKSPSVSKDTLVNAAANLAGIFMIIRHEHMNVIASKALGLIGRVR